VKSPHAFGFPIADTLPMPSEFHNHESPLPFGNPKSCPWYGIDIFWNRPFYFTVEPCYFELSGEMKNNSKQWEFEIQN